MPATEPGTRWRVGDPAPAPLPARSEADVIARWSDGPPLVSVLCATFQHVGFIEDALRGFLGQETDFPFEVIVRDDASTDGTAEIVRDYAERYPNIIRPVLETVNRHPEVKAGPIMRALAAGRFLAGCEGDDYWIVADKLQRQVTLLLDRPDLAVTFHPDVAVRDGVIIRVPNPSTDPELSPRQLRRSPTMSPRGMCYRADYPSSGSWGLRIPAADRFMAARLGQVGGGYEMSDLVGAVYRLHPGGIWSSKSREEQVAMMVPTHYWIADYFTQAGDRDSARYHLGKAAELIATVQLKDDVDPRLGIAFRLLKGWPRTAMRRLLARLGLRR